MEIIRIFPCNQFTYSNNTYSLHKNQHCTYKRYQIHLLYLSATNRVVSPSSCRHRHYPR